MEALWTWLNTPPGFAGVLDPFGLVFISIFAVGFLLSAYLAGTGGQDIARNPLEARAIRHWANVGLWVFGPGLFFFAMRALQINPLSFGEPIWLVACVIVLIVVAIRFAVWQRTRSPAESAALSHPRGKSRGEAPLSRGARERGVGG